MKWEYLAIDPDAYDTLNGIRTEAINTLLNKLGTQGWELVLSVKSDSFIFKRPKG